MIVDVSGRRNSSQRLGLPRTCESKRFFVSFRSQRTWWFVTISTTWLCYSYLVLTSLCLSNQRQETSDQLFVAVVALGDSQTRTLSLWYLLLPVSPLSLHPFYSIGCARQQRNDSSVVASSWRSSTTVSQRYIELLIITRTLSMFKGVHMKARLACRHLLGSLSAS